jgi:hypothetical protein
MGTGSAHHRDDLLRSWRVRPDSACPCSSGSGHRGSPASSLVSVDGRRRRAVSLWAWCLLCGVVHGPAWPDPAPHAPRKRTHGEPFAGAARRATAAARLVRRSQRPQGRHGRGRSKPELRKALPRGTDTPDSPTMKKRPSGRPETAAWISRPHRPVESSWEAREGLPVVEVIGYVRRAAGARACPRLGRPRAPLPPALTH